MDDYKEFTTSGMTWTPDERMVFSYDPLDRLTGAAPESGATGYSQSFQYNAIGNITSCRDFGWRQFVCLRRQRQRDHAH